MNSTIVDLGTIQAEGRPIKVSMRTGATTAWLVVSISTMDHSDLGTVKNLHLEEPDLVIFQRHQEWCTNPWTQWHIKRQVRDLYFRNYRSDP